MSKKCNWQRWPCIVLGAAWHWQHNPRTRVWAHSMIKWRQQMDGTEQGSRLIQPSQLQQISSSSSPSSSTSAWLHVPISLRTNDKKCSACIYCSQCLCGTLHNVSRMGLHHMDRHMDCTWRNILMRLHADPLTNAKQKEHRKFANCAPENIFLFHFIWHPMFSCLCDVWPLMCSKWIWIRENAHKFKRKWWRLVFACEFRPFLCQMYTQHTPEKHEHSIFIIEAVFLFTLHPLTPASLCL